MDDESLMQVEQQLSTLRPRVAPCELRASVLTDARRELRASGWDRRLGRAAAVLLVMGVGLNVGIGMRSAGSRGRAPRVVAVESAARQSLVDTAVVVAEATDAATGRRFARQLAAMSGRELTADEAAAIDSAMRRSATRGTTNGNKG